MRKTLALIVALALLFMALHLVMPFDDADYCLDSGGAWNDELKKCEGARPGYKGP